MLTFFIKFNINNIIYNKVYFLNHIVNNNNYLLNIIIIYN